MVEPGCQSSGGRVPDRRVERHVHRSKQAGLADGRNCVGGDGDVGPDPHLDIGHPVVNGQLPDAAHDDVVDHDRRIRLECTDIGYLDVVDGVARPAGHRTGKWQRVDAAEPA